MKQCVNYKQELWTLLISNSIGVQSNGLTSVVYGVQIIQSYSRKMLENTIIYILILFHFLNFVTSGHFGSQRLLIFGKSSIRLIFVFQLDLIASPQCCDFHSVFWLQ